MRKNGHSHPAITFSDKRWILPFFASLMVSVLIILITTCKLFSFYSKRNLLQLEAISIRRPEDSTDDFVEFDMKRSSDLNDSKKIEAPRLAYLISGTKGDNQRMMRTLEAVYHPRNYYILHLDLEAPPRERLDLTMSIKNDPMFQEIENVRVMAQSNLVTYKGPTMIATTLQAIAIMLKEYLDWDWFINLSASDYPLVTQEDLLHVLSNLSRNLNFIEHTRISGWKLNHRGKRIIIDPGLYQSKKSDIFWTAQTRSLPTSFRLFTGSAWIMLTRSFLEYSIWGYDNFPRTLLLYYANFISSPEGYFHTLICNSKFRDTAVSHDLHYIAWDNPPKQHPRSLSLKDFDPMVKSGALFARKFVKDDPVLDKIDRELLGRTTRFTLGALCMGSAEDGAEPCSVRGNGSLFNPGTGAARLQMLLQNLTAFGSNQCS